MNLRKAAKMALEFASWFTRNDHSIRPKYKATEVVEALRQALSQPEWVGLTDEELLTAYGWMPAPGAPDWILEGAKEELLGALRKVELKIREKNNG